MNKLCLWLLVVVISIYSSSLFAQDDPSYFHYKDYPTPHGTTQTAPGTPTYTYPSSYTFKNFATSQSSSPAPANSAPQASSTPKQK